MISKNDKDFFHKNRYLIKKGFFKENDLKSLTKCSLDVEKKALEGKWKYIKIYREYPKFKYLNVFGVEFPFNKKINKDTFNEFSKLNYKDFFCELVGWDNFKSTLLRLHTNSNFFKYQGEWHRDSLDYPSTDKFQLVIYLKDEKGFRIVPKCKNQLLKDYGIPSAERPNIDQAFLKLNKNVYDEIEANRGDLLIFQSSLLHQGYAKDTRLHYHIRHEKIEKQIKNPENPLNFVEKFLPDYDLTNEYYNPRYFQKNLLSILTRIKTLFFYFMPRIKEILYNLTHRKNKKTITHSTIWQ